MYITKNDLESGIYTETIDVLARNDEDIETSIKEAISEVSAYISARYDIETELLKTGTSRNTMIVKCVKDIAIWNIYKGSNPSNMSEARAEAYRQTINFLKLVQQERANIVGLQRKTDSTGGSTYIKFGSNQKRTNHY